MSIEEKARIWIRRKFKKADIKLDHILRVVNFSMRIGKAERVDIELINLAALLHDVAWKRDGDNKLHAFESASMASEWLEKQKYSKEGIKIITEAIKSHNSENPKEIKSLESKILWDADNLDDLGIVGFLRVIHIMGRNNDYDSFKKAAGWYRKHSEEISNRLSTKLAREIAKKKQNRFRVFLEEFKKEVMKNEQRVSKKGSVISDLHNLW